ncbi:MAG: bifunctional oligoribonuclease/PAP phosphatase NrnA [Caldiserica bacterium]|nr:bifunctional oligoribonuclease/PAP phosphatase NrnA [Caldisericota bacterium]
MSNINDICTVLKKYNSFALFTHVNADGDAIGSVLALGSSLILKGKKVLFNVPEPVPLKFDFLTGYDLINKNLDTLNQMEVGILLDAAGTNRIEDLEKNLELFNITINIDHHISNGHFATYNLVDGNAPSTTVLILRILEKCGFPINEDIANDLFTGLLTDTGSFHYANTNKFAFDSASKMLDYGAKPDFVSDMIFERETVGHLKMLGIALSRLIIENGIVYSFITLKDFEETGAVGEDTERIIDVLRRTGETKIALLFKETRKSEVRVSLRGKKGINVSEIAEHFGGGGHRAAAGCTIKSTVEKSIKRLIEYIKENYDNGK